jgi:hypothetical protein
MKKAINKKQNMFTLAFSALGAILGFTLLLITLQLFTDVDTIFKNESDVIDSEFLVLKKHVSTLNTIGLAGNTAFDTDEIEEIKNQDFIKDIAPFKNATFEVMAVLGMEGGKFPTMKSLAFFESVPDHFIDAETKNWGWEKGDTQVPIILPNTYLDAYNFGIAQAAGTPQVSKGIIGAFSIQLEVSGNGKKAEYHGNVINFSDRINSILVPNSFLHFANIEYGSPANQETFRVIVEVTDANDPSLKKYIEDNGYETNSEQLRGGKVEQILRGFLNFHVLIGIIIILQSAFLFVLYSQILIQKSKYEIQLLLILGYKWKTITNQINKSFILVFVLVGLVSFLCFGAVKLWFNAWLLKEVGMEGTSLISLNTLLFGVGFLLLFLFLTGINISNKVKHLAKPNS